MPACLPTPYHTTPCLTALTPPPHHYLPLPYHPIPFPHHWPRLIFPYVTFVWTVGVETVVKVSG